jgi:hypothetical protein
MGKENAVCVDGMEGSTIGYYPAFNTKGILPLVTTQMNLENILVSELGQAQKEMLHYFTYLRINLKKLTS